MRTLLRLLAVVLVLSAASAFAQPATPKRILFIGNSLTYWTDVPGRLEKLAEAMGRKVVVGTAAYPSYSLEDHWKDGRALTEIRKGWDVVVLQQGTSARDESRVNLIEYAKKFAGPIRAAGAKPAIYMSWPPANRPAEFVACIANHREAAAAIDATLLPVGEAWVRVLSKDKRAKLYNDGIHPTPLGGNLAVLTIYFGLFPAGPQEFTEAYVARIAKVLDIPADSRDLFFDAATLAIDQPLKFQE